jgi:hypothetical protein
MISTAATSHSRVSARTDRHSASQHGSLALASEGNRNVSSSGRSPAANALRRVVIWRSCPISCRLSAARPAIASNLSERSGSPITAKYWAALSIRQRDTSHFDDRREGCCGGESEASVFSERAA